MSCGDCRKGAPCQEHLRRHEAWSPSQVRAPERAQDGEHPVAAFVGRWISNASFVASGWLWATHGFVAAFVFQLAFLGSLLVLFVLLSKLEGHGQGR